MNDLKSLPNISIIMEKKLKEVGIETPEELKEVGSKEAFTRIRCKDNSACFNMLCGLEGAIKGIRWHNLSDEEKMKLKEFFKTVK